MAVSITHVFEQGPVLRGLARTAIGAIRQQQLARKMGMGGVAPQGPVVAPGPEFTAVLPPRSPKLISDYVRHVGGDPSAYKGVVPPHLFPQWSFGLAAQTLQGVPYPLMKVMNGGCSLIVNAPIPSDEPIHVRVRLDRVDDNGQRAILDQLIVSGTASNPKAIVAHLYAFVPLTKPDKSQQSKGSKASKPSNGAAKARPRVPDDARELAFWRIPANAGLDFAKLTGDFNPVHWIPGYAKSMGFKNTILHGFGTMARAWEGLSRNMLSGSARSITGIDVKFTRPLVLPARVGLYVGGDHKLWVGDAPGGGAYLEGSYTAKDL